MQRNDVPLGTIWIVSHDEHRTFDAGPLDPANGTVQVAARAPARAGLETPTDAERIRNEWVRQLITVQEEERRRIARELHDQLGAHLTTLGLRLDALHLEPASIGPLRQTLSDLDHDISRVVRDLRPGQLLDLGLASAVRAYVDEWSHHSAVSCDFHSNADQALPVLVATPIPLEIDQEATPPRHT